MTPDIGRITIARHGISPANVPRHITGTAPLPGCINLSFLDGHAARAPLESLWGFRGISSMSRRRTGPLRRGNRHRGRRNEGEMNREGREDGEAEEDSEAAGSARAFGLWWGHLVGPGLAGVRGVRRMVESPSCCGSLAPIRQFEQDVIPNSDNTRLVYCQDTAEGIGIYFCDTAGGKPRLLCEQKEKGHSWKRFTMLGWAPDDSLFACAFPDNQRNQELILIFQGRTGEPVGKVVADENFNHLAWLSTEAFAYSSRTCVRVVTRQANGSWVHTRYFQDVAANIEDFTAVSADSVAWRDGEGIWLFNLGSGSSEKIWEATTNRLVEFTYAKGANEFLLNCSDEEGQYLLRLKPENKPPSRADWGPVGFHPQRHLERSRGSYAYLTNDPAGSAFCIKTEEMATPIAIPWHGGVRSVTLSGGQLFFSGYLDNQPPGIWKYDLESKHSIALSPAQAARYEQPRRMSSCRVMTNSLGEQRFYHLWTPRTLTE